MYFIVCFVCCVITIILCITIICFVCYYHDSFLYYNFMHYNYWFVCRWQGSFLYCNCMSSSLFCLLLARFLSWLTHVWEIWPTLIVYMVVTLGKCTAFIKGCWHLALFSVVCLQIISVITFSLSKLFTSSSQIKLHLGKLCFLTISQAQFHFWLPEVVRLSAVPFFSIKMLLQLRMGTIV